MTTTSAMAGAAVNSIANNEIIHPQRMAVILPALPYPNGFAISLPAAAWFVRSGRRRPDAFADPGKAEDSLCSSTDNMAHPQFLCRSRRNFAAERVFGNDWPPFAFSGSTNSGQTRKRRGAAFRENAVGRVYSFAAPARGDKRPGGAGAHAPRRFRGRFFIGNVFCGWQDGMDGYNWTDWIEPIFPGEY